MTGSPFPSGTTARLHSRDDAPGWVVVMATPPLEPSLRALTRPGGVGALVTHDRGLNWPDRTGHRLVRATLETGGVAALAFDDLRDAMACVLRLRREGVK
jgi:hypothetical protein